MRASPPGRQAGYNLVMLMVAVTVLNIMVAISLPMWSELIQRDKEEELISRGFQYVEAIRVFQNRFQRQPVRLEELIEVKPRCIRRLWKDPMTDGGSFQPIFLNEGQQVGPTPVGPAPAPTPPPGPNSPPKNPPDDGGGVDQPLGPDGQPQAAGGPIVGVRSRSHKKSLLVFTGKEHYDEWRFTLDLMLQGRPPAGGQQVPPPQPGAPGAPGAAPKLSTRWIGRPSIVESPGMPPANPTPTLGGGPKPPPRHGGGQL
jgi:type II secretory pathway pseudopilin PulG